MSKKSKSKKKASSKAKKKLSYRLIEPSKNREMYRMLKELVESYHDELADARIALAWNVSWKPDKDGRLQLGKCKRASDLDREFMPYDLVIILNRDFWDDEATDDAQRRALMDHELCHGRLQYDKDGEILEDERGRKVFRLRKHVIEEFPEVVKRHGLWKRDLELMAKAILESKQGKLPLDEDDDVDSTAPPASFGPREVRPS